MASGRTVSASFLTEVDNRVLNLCASISTAIYEAIPGESKKREFSRGYGKISYTRDSGTGRGGGKLQRDMVCTRGRGGKAPFSNRNLRWHPLMVAENKPSFAKVIERIEIDGYDEEQVLLFVVRGTSRNEVVYPSDKVHEMPEKFVSLPKHWYPHIEELKYWSDTLWTQNSCVISALEACNWRDSVETYAILGIAVAVEIYGAKFDSLYDEVQELLQKQNIDERVSLPSGSFPDEEESILQCPLCRLNISEGLADFRQFVRGETWQPGWRTSKKTEGDDSSIQVMHVNPLVESEIRHTANNVRYGHRWCNVAMTDHSLDETLDFMEFVVRAHDRGK